MKRFALNTGWAALGALLLVTSCQSPASSSSTTVQNFAVDAAEAAYPQPASGVTAHVDTYKTNQTATTTNYADTSTNAALRLLSKFNDIYVPSGSATSAVNSSYATAYLTGTIKNASVFTKNFTYVSTVTAARTDVQAEAAWFDDRHGKTFSTITGFGPLASYVYTGTGISTSLSSVPGDATVYAYDDSGSDYSSSAITSSNSLYDMIALVRAVRASGASGNPSKAYFNSPRPWRVDNNGVMTENTTTLDSGYYAADRTTSVSYPTYTSSVSVVPALKPARSTKGYSDGGFPSGHTAEAFNSGLLMAYAVPERFQELLARAADLGENRILAGMHSPLDVMGGRVFATALSASGLADSANATVKASAFSTAHTWLKAQTGATDTTLFTVAHTGDTSAYADWATNKANYLKRLTYGFDPIASTTVAAVVPKGAEVLLETRQPYLTAAQRREVLRTTAIASGYPLLDDAEGWGRLNLFDAADGYGRFDGTTYVNMDASLVSSTQNGFYAQDTWRNNIGGTGRLVKQGSGTLTLKGTNTYSGGTRIEGGVLEAASTTALGSSDVLVSGGTLAVTTSDKVSVSGRFTQSSQGTLLLNLGSSNTGRLAVSDLATLGGTLVVNFATAPSAGTSYQVLTSGSLSGTFSTITVQVAGTVVSTVPTTTSSATGVVLAF